MAKLTQLKTSEGGFIETYSYSFYLFNPGKTVLGSTLLSRTKQDMRFGKGPVTLGLTEKDIKE